MLNISSNSVKERVSLDTFQSFNKIDLPIANRMFKYWLIGISIVLLIFLFLPWTQNIQSKGKVTTLDPSQRPQEIDATIAGRIEAWYVQEGQLVKKGDTIAYLSEIKVDYFDENLVGRTQAQVNAKGATIQAYADKVKALDNQIKAYRQALKYKKGQLENKIEQTKLKVESAKAVVKQAEVDFEIAAYQYRRTDTLYQKGIKSLTDLEGKQLKQQETQAKIIAAKNKFSEAERELVIAQLELSTVDNEYASKIAKSESDKFSTLSAKYDAQGSITKLENQYENYRKRSAFYYITAPQDCYINKALKKGIGETVKEGEPLVAITPANIELAVELYIRPMDLPLINLGEEVRFIFDGWPAFVFSGWPGMSFGTYNGHVVAIENNISENGKYRILVKANEGKPWPEALRVGSGAEGIALLNDVPLWYELWRQLNGFPPDFYDGDTIKEPKMKAPIKAIK